MFYYFQTLLLLEYITYFIRDMTVDTVYSVFGDDIW